MGEVIDFSNFQQKKREDIARKEVVLVDDGYTNRSLAERYTRESRRNLKTCIQAGASAVGSAIAAVGIEHEKISTVASFGLIWISAIAGALSCMTAYQAGTNSEAAARLSANNPSN